MELTRSKPQKTTHGFIMPRANVGRLSEEMRTVLVNVKSEESKNIVIPANDHKLIMWKKLLPRLKTALCQAVIPQQYKLLVIRVT